MEKIEFCDYEDNLYSSVLEFHDGMAAVRNSETNLWGFIDMNGDEIIPCQYSSVLSFSCGMAAVCFSNGLWGFIDKNNNVVIEPLYKKAFSFSEDIGCVLTNDESNYLYLNKNGEVIYKISSSINQDVPRKFHDGILINSLCHYINASDKFGNNIPLNKCKFFYGEYLSDFSDNLAVYYNGSKIKLLDRDFNIVKEINLKLRLWDVSFHDGIIICLSSIDNRSALLNLDLELITPFIFESIKPFNGDVTVGKIDNCNAIISKSGEVKFLVKDYSHINAFSEGLAAVRDAETNLWGFVDETGLEVIPCIYDCVSSFSSSMAAVKLDGKWIYISKDGNKVLECPLIYFSCGTYDNETFVIKEYSVVDRTRQKIDFLEMIRKKVIANTNDMIDSMKADEYGSLYDKTKSKKQG